MSAAHELTTGSTYAGHRILGLLGRGGMAEVYLARRPAPGSDPVVIKRLRPELAQDPTSHRMFLREATVTRMIDHPNIVKVIDLANVEHSHALIIEFVDGRNLTQVGRACYERRRYLPYGVIARLLGETLAALHHIHELRDPRGRHLRLIHRDISPENVLVTYDGDVKLVDFGIAKASHAALAAAHTHAGVVRGKARYVAPEAIRGEQADARADLFSVGVILYELLTYAHPFPGNTDVEIMASVVEKEPAPISEHNAHAPGGLERICMRALHKDPAARHRSALEMHDALGAWCDDEGNTSSAREMGGLMERLFPAHADAERLRLAELLREDVDEPTVEMDEGSSMAVGLLAETLLDDDDD